MKQTGKDMKFIVFYTVFWLAREHGRDRSGRDRSSRCAYIYIYIFSINLRFNVMTNAHRYSGMFPVHN